MTDELAKDLLVNNYLAVAAVTAVLRDSLQAVVGEAISGATVSTRRPEAANGGEQHAPGVNIFLYMVNPNPAWRNTEIEIRYPGAGKDPASGQEIHPERFQRRTLLPLNLSYLFSFYGNDQDLEPQRLLGAVMSTMHAHPRLSPENIRATIKNYPNLQISGLAEQVKYVEYVTLTSINLNLEELSKIWSVFFQVPYALSVAYQASTVLIEPSKPRDISRVDQAILKPAVPEVPA